MLTILIVANPNAALVINCFTGNGGRLADYLALSKNVFITITGFLSSDDRSADLRSCVKDIPLDRLVRFLCSLFFFVRSPSILNCKSVD